MRKLIALILISLLIPIPSANANGSSYQFVTPVLTTTYELPAQTYNSRWDRIEIPFSVILVSDGTVSTFSFRLIDAEGYKLSYPSLNLGWSSDTMYSPQTITQNGTWTLYKHQQAKLPITLQTEIYFWSSSGKASIIQNFPMKFVTHKDDTLAKTQADAVAKAQADAVAKAQAEAQRLLAEAKAKADAEAKVIADAKAKAEAEAKAKLEAEAKVIAEAKAKAEAEAKAILDAKAKAEADAKAKAEAEAKAEADAKAKLEYEAQAITWTCREDLRKYHLNTYNKDISLMNKYDSTIFCNNLLVEIKAKQEADAKAKAEAVALILKQQAEKLKRDSEFFQSLVNGTTCKKLGSTKLAGGKVFTCKKINKKLIWKM